MSLTFCSFSPQTKQNYLFFTFFRKILFFHKAASLSASRITRTARALRTNGEQLQRSFSLLLSLGVSNCCRCSTRSTHIILSLVSRVVRVVRRFDLGRVFCDLRFPIFSSRAEERVFYIASLDRNKRYSQNDEGKNLSRSFSNDDDTQSWW